jgi:hypothetical protein
MAVSFGSWKLTSLGMLRVSDNRMNERLGLLDFRGALE